MSDYKLQRENMVESQVRPSDVTDRRIIRAMLDVPREFFVPASLRATAYMDADLKVVAADGDRPARALMAPRLFAKLIQLARIDDNDIVLDVGCLHGYSAAVLARLAQTVVGLDDDEAVTNQAGKALADQGIDNAVVETGPLPQGVAGEGPFDVIVVEGAVPEMPPALLDQLKHGGRLVAIIAQANFGKAMLFERVNDSVVSRPAFDAAAAPLPGFARAAAFTF